MKYEIKLPQFEGPFDLLLFFIERDELDIYDIPIAKITADFLDYIHQMKALNIELASEFILVAATLMRIKAKMLLPRKELDEQGQEIDPRQELVEKLLEYKIYKEVIGDFKHLEEKRSKQFPRGQALMEIDTIVKQYSSTETDLESLSLYKLLKVFSRLLERYESDNKKVKHEVIRYAYTIADQKSFILKQIKQNHKATFEHIFEACKDRLHAIFTFLALLELLQEKFVRIKVGAGKNNFWIGAA